MSWKRALSLLGTLVLLASLLPLHVAGAAPAWQSAIEKVEPRLLDTVNANGKADFIVMMAEKADLSPAGQLETKEAKGAFVFQALRATAERTQRPLLDYLDRHGTRYESFYIANKVLVRGGNLALLMDIAARADVAQVMADHHFQVDGPIVQEGWFARTDSVEPNLSFIQADQVWALGITGRGTVLAGNDSGLDETHPAIARHYRGCLNPPLCTTWDHNYNWWDATGTYPYNPTDRMGEGTHTTGTMIGDDGGENQIGVAPGAQTIHCKNMDDSGGGLDSWFIECFQWDLAPWDLDGQNPRPDLAPDAVNNSWGYWGGNYPLFQDEVNALQAAGILVEAAAGNEGPSCGSLRSPGDYTQVLTTGSVDHDVPFPGVITNDTWSSSRGPSAVDPNSFFPDVMAPGHNIRSALPNGGYDYWSGTSMAGPHSVGLVGLMWSANPGLRGRVEETDRLIAETAGRLVGQGGSNCGGDYTNGPNNDWGYGTINALAAVQAAIHYGHTGELAGTVRDAATDLPIAGAAIQASLNPTLTWSATTDEAGLYSLYAFSGTYTVQASQYGYLPVTLPDVAIVSGTTTSQDITMSVAPSASLYGYVTDGSTGWPLYARIDIDGYPGAPVWTNPATGFYSVSLAVGLVYHLRVNGWVPGYLQSSRYVGPLSGPQQEDIALGADPSACSAPGYGLTTVYAQAWEAGDGGFVVGGTNPSWELGTPAGGPANAHSGTNAWGTGLAGNYNDGEESWIESPDLDLSSLAGAGVSFSWWQWLQTEYCCDWATVEVSNDGGATWGTVYQDEGDVDLNWTRHSLVLDSSYAVATFRVRFHLHTDGSANFPGWYIDDVAIAGNCHSTPGGLVVGTVSDSNTAAPLVGALVGGDSGRFTVAGPAEDPATGGAFYTLFSPVGTHVVTATMEGYNDDMQTVEVAGGTAVRQDFALASGKLAFSPLSMDVTLDLGARAIVPGTLTNGGDGAASFSIRERDRGFQRSVRLPLSIPPSDGNFGRGAAPDSVGPAPAGRPSAGGTLPAPGGLSGAPAYAIDLIHSNLVALQADDPGDWDIVGGVRSTFYYAGDFVQGDFSRLYVIDSGNVFWALDTATAQATRIEVILPTAGETWTGLAGAPDGTLYASSTSIGHSTLYTVDPGTGEATIVGEITNAPAVVDLAVNAAGEVYGLDIANDVLVGIDPETGAGTPIGWVGFDANYAQDMDFEEETGALYLAAYNNTTSQGELRLCDPATGNSMLIGAFPEGAEVDAFAFATGSLAELPWIVETPMTGALPSSATLPVTVTLDAGAVALPGRYRAALVFDNDTPYGPLSIPVTMTAVAPPSYGRLAGTVTGLGYCDADPAPLKRATVTVQGNSGATWNLSTDKNGAYELWLDQAETPVSIAVSYPEYEQWLQSGITVTGQQTTTVDFAPRWLKPCVGTEPPALDGVLGWGQNATLPLTLTNAGAGELHYRLREEDQGFQPLGQGIPPSDGSFLRGSAPLSLDRAPTGRSVESGTGGQSRSNRPFGASGYAVDLYNANLVNLDVDVPGVFTPIGSVSGAYYFGGDFLGGDFSKLYVIDPSANMLSTLDTGTALPTPVGACLAVNGESWSGLAGMPGGALYGSSSSGSNSTLYTIDPSTGQATVVGPITNGPAVVDIAANSAGELYGLDIANDVLLCINPSTGAGTVVGSLGFDANWAQDMDFDESTGVLYLAAFNNATNQGELRIADTTTGNSVPVGPFMGGVEVDSFAVATGGFADVPWLVAGPPTGTIPAGGQALTSVTLDASAVRQPGSYSAALQVAGDDPVNNRYPVLITMTVQPPADMGRLAGRVTDACDGSPLAAAVAIAGGSPITRTGADEEGNYVAWQIAGAYDVSLAADGYRPYTASVQVNAGQTTTLDAALVPERPCAAVTPASFEVRVLTGTATYTAPMGLQLANAGGQELTYRIVEVSGSIGLDELPTGEACLVAVTADNYTDPAETVQLHNTLTELGYSWVDVNSIQEARDAGAATLIVRFAGSQNISVDDLNGWMDEGHGVIQLGDWVPWFQTAWESAASGTPLNLTVVDGSHPLTRGLPPSWTGTGYFAYTWAGADALGWATDSTYPDLVEGRYTVPQPRAVTATEYGAGRAAYIGVNVYGSLAGPADRQLLDNAIGWTGGCIAQGVPWLAVEPMTGTVPAQSTAAIDLFFTSLYTDGTPLPLGAYAATLLISSNDRQAGTLRVPVGMRVVEGAVLGIYLPLVEK